MDSSVVLKHPRHGLRGLKSSRAVHTKVLAMKEILLAVSEEALLDAINADGASAALKAIVDETLLRNDNSLLHLCVKVRHMCFRTCPTYFP
jgi:hypothetical protein